MKTRLPCYGLFLALGIFAVSAHANTSCTGPINYLGVDASGNVFVDVGYGVWGVCNVSQPLTQSGSTVVQDACKAWYAALLAAQQSGNSATVFLNGTTACSTYGTWVFPGAYHVAPF